MLLQSLKLRNWCQHRSRDILFAAGMNVFLGRNGSGKSNAFRAIPFALTGAQGSLPGGKPADICQLAVDGEHSWVQLNFQHLDVRAELVRFLKGAQTTLTLYDRENKELERIRGDTKVTERVLSLLDTTEKMLNSYVFVEQGALFAPFSAAVRPADRAVAFQRLFGIDRAEELWATIGAKLSAMPNTMLPDMDVLEGQQLQTSQELADLQTTLREHQGFAGWSEASDPDADIGSRWLATQAAQSHRKETQELHASAVAAQGLRQVRLAELQTNRHTLGEAITKGEAQREELQKILQQAQAVDAWQQTRHERSGQYNTAQLNRQQASDAVATGVVYPVGYQDRLAAAKYSSELATAIHADETIVLAHTTAICPTCLRPMAPPDSAGEQQKREAQARLDYNKGAKQRVDKYVTDWDTAQAQQTNLQTRLQVAVDTLSKADSQLQEWDRQRPVAPAPDRVHYAKELLQTHLPGWKLTQSQFTSQLAPLTAEVAAAAATIQQLQEQMERQNYAVAVCPTPAEYQEAETRLSAKRAGVARWTVLQSQLAGRKLAAQTVSENLKQARQLIQTVQYQNRRRQRLTDIRSVLQREALPSRVTQRNLEWLEHDTNGILGRFAAPFRLQQEDGLSYRANFFDGRTQPLARLSGGEKVITALAFRIATNARFADHLGLLSLDEPTDGLDADNLSCLDLALERLREFSQAKGLQCILITHANLGHLFDHVENFGNT